MKRFTVVVHFEGVKGHDEEDAAKKVNAALASDFYPPFSLDHIHVVTVKEAAHA
jgi:hypothetical protein